MIVFKFGGASVKDAQSVRNVAEILRKHQHESIMVVVSAMGKTTNALEKVLFDVFHDKESRYDSVNYVIDFHSHILSELFPDPNHTVYVEIQKWFDFLRKLKKSELPDDYDKAYDIVVSSGEMMSSLLLHFYLNDNGLPCTWFDARECIVTDETWREGKIQWQLTEKRCHETIENFFLSGGQLALTQGFIGGTIQGETTTLGREGSDYSAAILAWCLKAGSVTIWKDVPGLLNADPKHFSEAIKLDSISYREAIELAYYGATIIHPKTIKPLENKNIPLFVRSFLQPTETGSVIHSNTAFDGRIPSFIFKNQQTLISVSPRDFSFIGEENLALIFGAFARFQVKVNLMQQSAISFSVCADVTNTKLAALIGELQKEFKVKYNENLQLITIRHYNEEILKKLLNGRKVLLEQRSRTTLQMVIAEC